MTPDQRDRYKGPPPAWEPDDAHEVDERDDDAYCDCGVFHDEEEEASGQCSFCGKLVEWMP